MTTANSAVLLEELLQFLYLTPVGVIKFRSDGSVDLMNPAASALLLPLTPDAMLNDIYTALASVVPDLQDKLKEFAANAGVIINHQRLEVWVGGKVLVLSLTVNRINDLIYMAVLKDVTKIVEQERKLLANALKFRAIFDHVRDYAIYTITLDGIIDDWNQSLLRFAGWLAADVQGKSLNIFFPQDDPDLPHLDLLLSDARRLGSVETEGWRLKRDGSRLWVNTVITALPDETGAVRGFVVVSRDMTTRKKMEDQNKLLASVDPLTGAYNRRQGQIRLSAEFSRHTRDGLPFAVLMLDIDHFKSINDRFGHPAGDAVLRALVTTCQTALRPIDIVTRWGGEEFLLILPDIDAAAALSAAERLRHAVSEMTVVVPEAPPIRVTVSIGVAVPVNEDLDELLRRSDIALYSAKTGGRDRVVLAPSAVDCVLLTKPS